MDGGGGGERLLDFDSDVTAVMESTVGQVGEFAWAEQTGKEEDTNLYGDFGEDNFYNSLEMAYVSRATFPSSVSPGFTMSSIHYCTVHR